MQTIGRSITHERPSALERVRAESLQDPEGKASCRLGKNGGDSSGRVRPKTDMKMEAWE